MTIVKLPKISKGGVLTNGQTKGELETDHQNNLTQALSTRLNCYPNEVTMTLQLWPLILLEGDEDFSEKVDSYVRKLSAVPCKNCILYDGRGSDRIVQLC